MGLALQGEDMRIFTISEDHFCELSDDNGGFCVECGEEAYGVEPDARAYECECCGESGVYGAEELLIMGQIQFSEE